MRPEQSVTPFHDNWREVVADLQIDVMNWKAEAEKWKAECEAWKEYAKCQKEGTQRWRDLFFDMREERDELKKKVGEK